MNSSASSKQTASVQNSFWSKLQTHLRKMPQIREVRMPIPIETKVAAICNPPCLKGVLIRVLYSGKSVEVIVQASIALGQWQEAATIALMIPPSSPGMPCRLWTPQVSQSPIFSSKQGDKQRKPRVETIPPKKPMNMAAPRLVVMPAAAPMITPPARVALRMYSIVNFSLRNALIAKVDRQLPVKDKIVLMMICVFAKAVLANAPKLKEGQNIQRNRVPMNAKTFEKQFEVGLVFGLEIEEQIKLNARPEYAPNAWMTIDPPTSYAWIFSMQMTSLMVNPISWKMHMRRHSSGPTLPTLHPKVTNIEAAEQRASVKSTSVKQMQQLSALKPQIITLFQKALNTFMKKVQEMADQEKDLEKAMRKPKPISIITLTSWKAGQRLLLSVLSIFAGLSILTKTPYRTMMIASTTISKTAKVFMFLAWCQAPPCAINKLLQTQLYK